VPPGVPSRLTSPPPTLKSSSYSARGALNQPALSAGSAHLAKTRSGGAGVHASQREPVVFDRHRSALLVEDRLAEAVQAALPLRSALGDPALGIRQRPGRDAAGPHAASATGATGADV
jgi:hypothetical protein